MSKGKRQSRINIDETELIELVKQNPVLYNPADKRSDDIIEDVWDEIAEKLNAPVNIVQKRWKNLKDEYGRGTNLRSSTRLNFLPPPSIELSNDNSCVSSNCSSPKGDGKRSTRSVSQLSTASETERSRSTLASNFGTLLKHKASRRSKTATPILEDASSVTEIHSAESNVRRSRDGISTVENVLRPRLSEPSFLSSKELLESAISSASRRMMQESRTMSDKVNSTTDSTHTFFESMAMTVSTFPQHIQATIKVQICNIVGETEYGLSC